MKKILGLILAIIFILNLTGCGQKGPAAIVNGVEISRAALDAEVEYDLTAYREQGVNLSAEEIAAVKKSALDRLISTYLLKEAAAGLGINATTVDVEGELTAVREGFADEEAFLQALEAADFTLETYKLALADILIVEALFEKELALSAIEVGAEEVQELMDSYLAEYEGEEEIDEEDLREYVAFSLKEQKAQALRSEYVEKLWQASEIEYGDI